jgi:hypothetical protein
MKLLSALAGVAHNRATKTPTSHNLRFMPGRSFLSRKRILSPPVAVL